MQDHSPPARRNHLQRTAGPYTWVTSDKTHIEHNESALTLTADMPADMDFRYNGPTAEKRSASYSLGKFGSMAYGFNSMSIWIKDKGTEVVGVVLRT